MIGNGTGFVPDRNFSHVAMKGRNGMMLKKISRLFVCLLVAGSLVFAGGFVSSADAAAKVKWKLAQTWGSGFPIFGDAVIEMAALVKEMSN